MAEAPLDQAAKALREVIDRAVIAGGDSGELICRLRASISGATVGV
jgi:hypothetical protein